MGTQFRYAKLCKTTEKWDIVAECCSISNGSYHLGNITVQYLHRSRPSSVHRGGRGLAGGWKMFAELFWTLGSLPCFRSTASTKKNRMKISLARYQITHKSLQPPCLVIEPPLLPTQINMVCCLSPFCCGKFSPCVTHIVSSIAQGIHNCILLLPKLKE